MKSRYKHIHFVPSGVRQDVWNVKNNKSLDTLAVIEWYPPWKQFVLQATPDCVFSVDCLQDIIAFMGELTKERAR